MHASMALCGASMGVVHAVEYDDGDKYDELLGGEDTPLLACVVTQYEFFFGLYCSCFGCPCFRLPLSVCYLHS